jgi:hypothetical protein
VTMPVSHVTVRVPLTVRRRPGRKTLVWLRFGVEGGSIATKADPALLEGGGGVGTSAQILLVQRAGTTRRTAGPDRDVMSNPTA